MLGSCPGAGVSVQDSFGQRIPSVAEFEGEKGALLVQQAEKELVTLPDGQLRHLGPGHPFQHPLGAVAAGGLPLPPVGGEQVHIFPHSVQHKGDDPR